MVAYADRVRHLHTVFRGKRPLPADVEPMRVP
jgi:hypothetical protein